MVTCYPSSQSWWGKCGSGKRVHIDMVVRHNNCSLNDGIQSIYKYSILDNGDFQGHTVSVIRSSWGVLAAVAAYGDDKHKVLTCTSARLAARTPTQASGIRCRATVSSLLRKASARCRLTCFLRLLSITSTHFSTMPASWSDAPARDKPRYTTLNGEKNLIPFIKHPRVVDVKAGLPA